MWLRSGACSLPLTCVKPDGPRSVHPPVTVKATIECDVRHTISDVQAAREQLIQWTKRGPKWYLAAGASLASPDDKLPPHVARREFVEVAIEEGMLLYDPEG